MFCSCPITKFLDKKPFLFFCVVFLCVMMAASFSHYKRRKNIYLSWAKEKETQYVLKEGEAKKQITQKIEDKYKEEMTAFAILAKTAEIERQKLKELEEQLKIQNEKKAAELKQKKK